MAVVALVKMREIREVSVSVVVHEYSALRYCALHFCGAAAFYRKFCKFTAITVL